jgi:CRP/FNR family transcriptional regulator, cyclic AMP receptor protein
MVSHSNPVGKCTNFCIDSFETYQNGQVIFNESSRGDWIYVVEEGAVEISKIIEGRKIVIAIINPGEIFGEVSYILKVPRSAKATAVGKTIVGIVDRHFFDQEFNNLTDHCKFMLETMAQRLVKTTGNYLKIKRQTLI